MTSTSSIHSYSKVGKQIVDKKIIRKQLVRSKALGKKIGIFCSALGEELYTGFVESVQFDGTDLVVFNWFDQKSNARSKSHIYVDEIEALVVN